VYFVVIPAGNNFNARYLMLMQSRLLLTLCYVLLSGTLLAQSVPPIFNLSAGFYATEQSLQLSHPRSDVVIHYTLDGTTPGPSSPVYSGPITLRDRTADPDVYSLIPTNDVPPGNPYNEEWLPPRGPVFKGTVVRAVAVDAAGWTSPVNTSTYFIHPEGAGRYQLPVFSISVDPDHFFSDETGIYVRGLPDSIPNYDRRGADWERPIHLEFFEADGRRILSHGAGARIHGGTSRNRPLKTLRLYARNEYGQTWFNYPFFADKPVARYKRLLLRNSGNDWSESMLRDLFMQQLLVGSTELDVQHGRPAVVFINGEFWGIKNIRDRFDERYLQSHYGIDTDQATFLGPAFLPEGYDYFAVARDNPEGLEHFRELFRMFSTVVTFMNDARIAEIGEKMDLRNFTDYNAAQIYFRNTDWPGNNKLFWRYNFTQTDSLRQGPMPRTANVRDGRWRWMVFDTDFGFGLDFDYVEGSGTNFGQRPHGGNDAGHNTITFALEEVFTGWPNPRRSTFMLRSLLINERFRHDFINRYADLLNSAFKAERVTAVLDSLAAQYRPHMDEHSRRWNQPASLQAWEEEINRMRTFALLREDALRAHLGNELDAGEERRLTVDVSDERGGRVRVNTLVIDTALAGVHDGVAYPWEGIYFSEVPVNLEAIAAPGQRFVRWEVVSGSASVPETGALIAIELETALHLRAVFEPAETGVHLEDEESALPRELELLPPSPNPFNPSTTVRYRVPDTMHIRLEVFDVTGRSVRLLASGLHNGGEHQAVFSPGEAASGVYLVRLQGDAGFSDSRTVSFVK